MEGELKKIIVIAKLLSEKAIEIQAKDQAFKPFFEEMGMEVKVNEGPFLKCGCDLYFDTLSLTKLKNARSHYDEDHQAYIDHRIKFLKEKGEEEEEEEEELLCGCKEAFDKLSMDSLRDLEKNGGFVANHKAYIRKRIGELEKEEEEKFLKNSE